MVTSFTPDPLSFTIGQDTRLLSFFDTQWTTVPTECYIQYRLSVKSRPAHAADPTLYDPNLIAFDPSQSDSSTTQMTVNFATNQVFNQDDYLNIAKYNAGTYVVEVRAWTDNAIDTGYFKEM